MNKEAINELEDNNIDGAIKLFQKAVLEKRDVQSLTNLAWVLWHEEDDLQRALSLVTEAVEHKPTSHFPYSLCGELLLRNERYEEALKMLQLSISIQPTKAAFHNMGVAYYYLGDTVRAANHFGQAAGKSDYTLYNQVKCLIECGQLAEAKRLITTFDESDEDFIGEVDIAELYTELDLHPEAILWFEKGWEDYYKQPDWIGRYIHSLIKTNQETRAHEIINEVIQEKKDELHEAEREELDADWSEQDKQENMLKLTNEIKSYENMFEDVRAGNLLELLLEPSAESGCYLFGCERHQHPEYKN
ncbi:tetratricopeptide repeat protein [Fictibacillus sp. UD]|uniref:tetratricopeptide repeat protein n=1 Tax=Fictibacillus sp. UD TaxID=3038777 RepID=UPI0037476595